MKALKSKDKEKLPPAAIREELLRILESPMFAQSERLSQFLRFTVENTIEGKIESLKEYAIGTEVYNRKPPYDPRDDSIVRSEARRLRTKLKEYYESIGKHDPIFIYYRPGSYVPVFRSRNHIDAVAPGRTITELYSDGPGVAVAVLPFVDLSKTAVSSACAQGITDELTHALVRTDGIRVTAASSVGPLLNQSLDIPALAQRLKVQIVFEGTVWEDRSKLRITSRIVKADGFQLWSQRFEAEPEPKGLFEVSEQLVSALVSRTRPEVSMIRKGKASAGASMLAVYPLVLAAEALLDEGSLATAQAALTKFQEAAQLQRGYARPICGIAQCYCEMALRGIPNSAKAVALAKEAALQAFATDPEMLSVPATMGCVSALSGHWVEAENQFKHSLELGEHSGALRQYALLLAALGRFDEAWDHARQAQRIDPFSYRQKVIYAKLFHLSRKYNDGLEHFSNRSLYGNLPVDAELYLALILLGLKRQDEALQLARGVQSKAGAQASAMEIVAEVLAGCGETAASQKIAHAFRLFSLTSPISKFRQALLYLAMEDSENALSLLSQSYDEREAELIWLVQDPRLDKIRDDQRYKSLVAKVVPAVAT